MHFKFKLNFLLGLLLLAASSCSSPQIESASKADANQGLVLSPVTVYLVRHAEKDLSSPSDQDPPLLSEGEARASSLQALLHDEPIQGLYVTRYKRSQQTLKPLANERQLTLTTYESNDFHGLKQRLLQQHAGQTVVVAGHSNTLLPLLEEFGAKTQIKHIPETTYDYLFKVVLQPDQTATLEVSRYNSSSSSSSSARK